jgi:hypothetical protein
MAVLPDTKQTNRQTKMRAAAKQNLCVPARWIAETHIPRSNKQKINRPCSKHIELSVGLVLFLHTVYFDVRSKSYGIKGKGKALPLQAYGTQRVLGWLRLPDSVTSALKGGRFSALRTDRLYPQEYDGTHF